MEAPRKIVLGVDGSQHSHTAFRWVLDNVLRESDHLIILHSAPHAGFELPEPDFPNEYFASSVAAASSQNENAERIIREESKTLVNKYLAMCQEAEVSCEGKVVEGEPASWIVEECSRLGADIVAVGSRQAGLIKRTLLGSVGDDVLHSVHCPVIIVRTSEGAQLLSKSSRKIVIAVDDSKEAVHAVGWSMQNVCRETDKIVVYHVHNSTIPSVASVGTGEFGIEEVYLPPSESDEVEIKAWTESEKLVEKFMAYILQESKMACEGKVVMGETESKVCEGLSALDADAVIVGTHEKGVVARTFLGSVSDYLAHHSPCPLIVVKSKQDNVDGDEALHKHFL